MHIKWQSSVEQVGSGEGCVDVLGAVDWRLVGHVRTPFQSAVLCGSSG